jgi:hypothetical protein
MARVGVELPPVLYVGLPVLGLALVFWARGLRRDVPSAGRRAVLVTLRGLALLTALVLLARPFVVAAGDTRERRNVVVLVDDSRSMGLTDAGATRHRQAVDYARALEPALRGEGYEVRPLSFDASTRPLDLSRGAAAPTGDTTDLGTAFLQGVLTSDPPPAALLALTDGAANRAEANTAALLALVETRTPVVAVGFGRDQGVPSLSLRRLSAPPRVPPQQSFRVTAQLHSSGGPLPAFDLLLFRDGALAQTRHVGADQASAGHVWTEGFEITEAQDGLFEYAVQLRLPSEPKLVTLNTRSSLPVRVGKEKDFRILYVQGALAWDFKFINRALRGDPSIRVTGLSRTSKQSVFRQNVESAGELAEGFPRDLGEIAPYRVLVLSELKAGDLSPAQQELVARFCGELGGGVLMIGGQSTFDESWRGSRLEQLLPVTLDSAGVVGLDRAFHLRLTDEARGNPVFAVATGGDSARAWDGLPAFSGYGRIADAKPGATVWARHADDDGPKGRRILMASHPYGAGVAAVIAVQNFWRWRLAKESDPQAFDRFWQQFLRFLGQSGSQEFQIQFLDQDLRTGIDLRALVEKRPRPEGAERPEAKGPETYRLHVRGPDGAEVLDQKAAIVPLRPVEIHFRADKAGIYTVAVEVPGGVTLASQPIEILDVDREMERTGRDMDTLRQWAAASQGAALLAEDCVDPRPVVARLKTQIEAARRAPSRPRPLGLHAGVLAWLLVCLGGEWILRKRWGLR